MLKFGVFLSIAVGVVDKIKKNGLSMKKLFAAIKGITGKIQKNMHTIFIWKETLLISLSLKKIGILDPLF